LMPVDTDFLTTMQIEMAEGRFFSEDFPSDSTEAFVINETAARLFGDGSAVGERLDWYFPGSGGFALQASGRVVGVVRDFHSYSLHNPIRPTVMVLPVIDWLKAHIAVRVSPLEIDATLADLEGAWSRHVPESPFEYTFLDEEYDRLYHLEKTTERVFGLMTLMALIVACIGLVGLSSYVASRRTKEVGIRKVLGAGTRDVALRLMQGFLALVGSGILIAVPLTWIAMTRWLDRFAYRVDVSPATFVVVGGLSLLIAALVVSYHTLRVARSNPADCLRSE
ncbi:MAG: FtsX-like permease family protein, partial [Rhodothermales bacterium]|nr:FtsX-like permease family protein [Rhodothermales bacterium]